MATTASAAVVLVAVILMTITSSASGETPIPTILSNLGFQRLSIAAASANLSPVTPITIFAATDSSLLTCPSCFLPLLLQENALPGLYSLHFLRTLAFGTKLRSFANQRCITITTTAGSTSSRTVFVNGVEIARPDMYDDGVLVVHGIQGFVAHVSPHSCAVEAMVSPSVPRPEPPMEEFIRRRLMLKNAMTRLRSSGFSVVALAMRVHYPDLAEVDQMTLFAVDDDSIFLTGSRGSAYVAEVGLHIVPGMVLSEVDMKALQRGDTLPTMKPRRSLVVTSGDGGQMATMRINYVKVKEFEVVRNDRIVVHRLPTPFRDLGRPYVQLQNSP